MLQLYKIHHYNHKISGKQIVWSYMLTHTHTYIYIYIYTYLFEKKTSHMKPRVTRTYLTIPSHAEKRSVYANSKPVTSSKVQLTNPIVEEIITKQRQTITGHKWPG